MTAEDLASIACIISLIVLVLLGGSPNCIPPRPVPCAHEGRVHYVRDIRAIE